MYMNTFIILMLCYLSYKKIYNHYFIIFIAFFGLILLFIGHYVIKNLEKNKYEKEKGWETLFNIFREMRHEFQNNLQIIYGMIQLEKYDLVLKYIMDIKKADESISHICNLSDKKLLCFLLEQVYLLRKRDIDVVVEVNINKTIPKISDKKYRELEKSISELKIAEDSKKLFVVIDDSGIQLYP